MEQLQLVGEFVWKWRFWFCLGLVVIFAAVIQPIGTAAVKAKVLATTRLLDGAFNIVSPFANGQHPNQKWVAAVEEKKNSFTADLGKTTAELFQEQQKLMTWPAIVAEEFNPRPFGVALDDKRGELLSLYFRAFEEQIVELRKVADPLTLSRDGVVTGKVVLRPEALERPKWTDDPKTGQAWLAQEQIWVQRAILATVARINAQAENWYDAPIHQIFAVRLGEAGLDSKRLNEGAEIKLQTLVDPTIPQTNTPGPSSGSTADGLAADRYLELSPDYRLLPVYVALLVDERRMPDIIAGFSQTDFAFVVQEIAWSKPKDKIQIPDELIDNAAAGGASRDTINFAIELKIWGDMRIFEMPADLKQKYAEQKQAASQPPAPPVQ